jgi:hypothetical protein
LIKIRKKFEISVFTYIRQGEVSISSDSAAGHLGRMDYPFGAGTAQTSILRRKNSSEEQDVTKQDVRNHLRLWRFLNFLLLRKNDQLIMII